MEKNIQKMNKLIKQMYKYLEKLEKRCEKKSVKTSKLRQAILDLQVELHSISQALEEE